MTMILHVKPKSCTFNKRLTLKCSILGTCRGYCLCIYTVPISTYGSKRANPSDNVFQLPTEYLKSRLHEKYCIY